MERSKVVNLYCTYTGLSVVISILAWLVVFLGYANVAPAILNDIGVVDWMLGFVIYFMALWIVFNLYKKRPILDLFLVYLLAQSAVVWYSFLKHGTLYFAAAGSQATLPAIVISAAMFIYLIAGRNRVAV